MEKLFQQSAEAQTHIQDLQKQNQDLQEQKSSLEKQLLSTTEEKHEQLSLLTQENINLKKQVSAFEALLVMIKNHWSWIFLKRKTQVLEKQQ